MAIPDGTYTFGADHGLLMLRTSRTGLGRRAGHDLTIEATRWIGHARISTSDPESSEVDAEVDANSLVVRKGTGGIKPLTEADRQEIAQTMRGDKLLRADQHPTIAFRSTRINGSPQGFTIDGDLTIAGRTEPITVYGAVTLDDRLRGTATVVQSRWGIKPYSAFFGALKLNDEVAVEFDTALRPAA
jgi:polyisoprenoid-binding protein YceI